MKVIAMLLAAFTFSASAQTVVRGVVVNRVETASKPSFFFKVHPSGNLLAFSTPKDVAVPNYGGTNNVFNLQTGVTTTIPGPYDPVFVGDSGLMVIPLSNVGPLKYGFFKTADLEAYRESTPVLHLASGVKGYYQSAGVLKRYGNGVVDVRVIAEVSANAHTLQDFRYSAPENTITELNPGKGFCSNFKLKLPMLSKDGALLGALDIDTNTSGVFRLNADDTCVKIFDVGIKTGKINFSSDNRMITYHIYNSAVSPVLTDESTNYVALPDGKFLSDIFVVDLAKRTTIRVTANRTSNSMYPDFTLDGRLVFIDHPHAANENVTFVFVRL